MTSVTKTCPWCGNSFVRQANRQVYCSDKCRATQNSRNYHARHREKLIEVSRAWHAANPERAKETRRAWHEKNRDKANAARRARRERLRDEENAKSRANHAKNREQANADRREWHAENRDESNSRRRQYRVDHLEDEKSTQRKWRARTREQRAATSLVSGAKYRAVKKNLPFDLTKEWVLSRWTGHCELSGLPFSVRYDSPGPKFYSPSIDRIDPKLGYTQANCRVVLWAVNSLKHDGTDADMYRVAKALCDLRPSENPLLSGD